MREKTDSQYINYNRIDHEFSAALNEVNNLCPNVDCKTCEYSSNCVATYRNRMKAMFLKGTLYACKGYYSYYDFLQLLNKMINNG